MAEKKNPGFESYYKVSQTYELGTLSALIVDLYRSRVLCLIQNGRIFSTLSGLLCRSLLGSQAAGRGCTYRVFGFAVHKHLQPSRAAQDLNDLIKSTYIPHLSGVVFEGAAVPPPIQLPWSVSCGHD